MDHVSKAFYWLVDTSLASPGGVSKLDFQVIDDTPFDVFGLGITPLPVQHGPKANAFGYRFGDIVYISDVSEIPETTANLIYGSELMVMDALRPLGVTGIDMPLTPEKVWKAIRQGEGS